MSEKKPSIEDYQDRIKKINERISADDLIIEEQNKKLDKLNEEIAESERKLKELTGK